MPESTERASPSYADEIRKLAEASSQNSREIGSSLGEIIENIREATETSDQTLTTFTKTVSES